MEAETAQEAHSLLCWLMDEAVLHPGSPRLPKGRSRTFQAHWSFLLRFFRADEWGCWNQRGLCVLSSSSLAPEVQLDHLYIRSNFSICPSASQNPPCWRPSWLSIACATRKHPESEGLARDNPETNPITIKPGTASHVAEQFSWFPLPPCSPLWCPFPIKALALSTHVSSDNSFLSVRQASTLMSWMGLSSYKRLR